VSSPGLKRWAFASVVENAAIIRPNAMLQLTALWKFKVMVVPPEFGD
jgi:hypothetical protein